MPTTRKHAIEALNLIAQTPLWGETIEDAALRAIYEEHGEYGEDGFEPCCDTESDLLRDAVETARVALGLNFERGES